MNPAWFLPFLALLLAFPSAAQEVRPPNRGGMIKSMGQPAVYLDTLEKLIPTYGGFWRQVARWGKIAL